MLILTHWLTHSFSLSSFPPFHICIIHLSVFLYVCLLSPTGTSNSNLVLQGTFQSAVIKFLSPSTIEVNEVSTSVCLLLSELNFSQFQLSVLCKFNYIACKYLLLYSFMKLLVLKKQYYNLWCYQQIVMGMEKRHKLNF